MIDPEEVPAQQVSGEDPPCYAPRGDFLIGLAQEALSFTKRRKLEKEIAVIKSALKGHDDKPTTRRAEQLKTCLLYTSPSPRDGLLSRMPSSA